MSLCEYGERLEALGKMFQDPECRIEDLLVGCAKLGLILSFRVEPDLTTSVGLELPEKVRV